MPFPSLSYSFTELPQAEYFTLKSAKCAIAADLEREYTTGATFGQVEQPRRVKVRAAGESLRSGENRSAVNDALS